MQTQEFYEAHGYKNGAEYYRALGYEDHGYISPELSSSDTYPSYIEDEVKESVKSIQGHQNADTITFGFMTDIHYALTYNHEIRFKRTANAYKEIAKRAHVDMLLLGGDFTNEGCREYKSDCFRELRAQLDGINYYPSNGNHDDGSIWDISYAALDKSVNHLTHGDLYKLFYNHLPSKGAEFDEKNHALYYMYNDKATKTRYVALDTGDIPYIFDNGKLRYSAQWLFAMSQAQLDWLINKALRFEEEGWSIVFFMHSAWLPGKQLEIAKALDVFNKLLDAYKKGSDIKGEFNEGDLRVFVDAEFSKFIRGDIICCFVGDYHTDYVEKTPEGIPFILTGNSVTYRGGMKRPPRNDGDKTEMLFDIATVDKKARKIFVTRVGCGDDREIEY